MSSNFVDIFDMIENLDYFDADYVIESMYKSLNSIYKMEKVVQKNKEIVLKKVLETNNIVEKKLEEKNYPVQKHEKQYKSDIEKDIFKRIKTKKHKNQRIPPKVHVNHKDNSLSPQEKLLKKLYKKIAINYHPDKCTHKNKHKLFHYVNTGNDTQNIPMLVYLIYQFDLHDIDFTAEDYLILKFELDKLKNKEEQLKHNLFYKWDSLDPVFKENYMHQMVQIHKPESFSEN